MRCEVDETLQRSKWGALLQGVSDDEKTLKVQVNIPATAIIGKYKFTVEIQSETEEGVRIATKPQTDVIVIFNPFCPRKHTIYLQSTWVITNPDLRISDHPSFFWWSIQN